jgi:hypothetical protein
MIKHIKTKYKTVFQLNYSLHLKNAYTGCGKGKWDYKRRHRLYHLNDKIAKLNIKEYYQSIGSIKRKINSLKKAKIYGKPLFRKFKIIEKIIEVR